MHPTLDRQLKAISTLLSDRDEKTVRLVRQTLIDLGPEAIPSLIRAQEAADPRLRRQLHAMVSEIRQVDLENRFREYGSGAESEWDLEEGALLIARFGYPDLSVRDCSLVLDRLSETIAGRLTRNPRSEEIIREINDHLFQEKGFCGNARNYYDPDNSFLNRVIERRTGIPISLSVVYLLIAGRLGLPMAGVGFPGHFMLKHERKDTCLFLDAFNKGRTLSRDACVQFLLNSGYDVQPHHFLSVTIRDILIRILRNLAYAYSELNDPEKAHRLTRLIHILQAPAQG